MILDLVEGSAVLFSASVAADNSDQWRASDKAVDHHQGTNEASEPKALIKDDGFYGSFT
jgi:hypothetical protein